MTLIVYKDNTLYADRLSVAQTGHDEVYVTFYDTKILYTADKTIAFACTGNFAAVVKEEKDEVLLGRVSLMNPEAMLEYAGISGLTPGIAECFCNVIKDWQVNTHVLFQDRLQYSKAFIAISKTDAACVAGVSSFIKENNPVPFTLGSGSIPANVYLRAGKGIDFIFEKVSEADQMVSREYDFVKQTALQPFTFQTFFAFIEVLQKLNLITRPELLEKAFDFLMEPMLLSGQFMSPQFEYFRSGYLRNVDVLANSKKDALMALLAANLAKKAVQNKPKTKRGVAK